MSLIIAFDDVNARGNQFAFDYLSSQFPTVLVPPDDVIAHIKQTSSLRCLFTTCPFLAQGTSSLIPTVLYLNDPCEDFKARQSNISHWRQNLGIFKKIDSIFVASSSLATAFLNTYRTPCKIQYPCVPKKDKSQGSYILYNKFPNHLSSASEVLANESYLMYEKPEDFENAKIYIHIPESNEQWHINLLLAHTHGVPCLTYQQGCFSEFCTAGDKLMPGGCDVRTWLNNFKLAVRDCSVNSKIVYDMSRRFHTMNEVQQRIKRILTENGMRQSPPTFNEVQNKALGVEAVKKLQARPKSVTNQPVVQKVLRPSTRHSDFTGITPYITTNSIYAGVGGLGDAFLTLAAAKADPGTKIIFGSNGGVRSTVKQLFDTFGVDSLVVGNFNGSNEGVMTWNAIFDHVNCKSAIHVPRSLNYGDWGNNGEHYLKKITKTLPAIEMLGKLVNPRATKKVIGLAPRGSDHTSIWKQRYLTRDEYKKVVQKLLLDDATVLVFGSENDFEYYGVYPNNNVIFMNSQFCVSHPAPRYPCSMRHMLTAVNVCDYVISVDTWLKTYAALVGIPCKVIMNRYFGKSTTEFFDPSDNVFLAPSFWGFDILPLESFF